MTTIVTRAGKGSALTWTEGDANITNLNNDKIENVVEDLTPQLGGDLDVNGKQIVSTANGNINIVPNGSGNINLTPATGHVTISATNFPTGTGSNGQVLTTDGTGNATWTTPSSGSTSLSALSDVSLVAPATGEVLQYNGTSWTDVATSTLTVGTASVASTVTLTADNTTAATNYPLFANAATGNLSPRTDTGFTYNPSTGALTATSFVGSLTGNASTATTATNATNINISTNTGNTNDSTLSLVMVAGQTTGNQAPHIDTGLGWDATNNKMTLGSSGATNAAGVILYSNSTGTVTVVAPSSYSGATTLTLPTSSGTLATTTSTMTGAFTGTSVSATGNINANSTTANSPKLTIGGSSLSSTAWTTLGVGLRILTATYTDTSSLAGTVASSHPHAITAPTMASTNAITVTDAGTLYISGAPTAGTNTTITNGWALLANGPVKATSFTGSGSGLTSIPNSALTNNSITINGTAVSLGGTASVGTVTSVAALTLGTTGTDVSSTIATGTTTPVITLNIPTASSTNRGALSSADWTTFNNKQAAIGTISGIAKGNGANALTAAVAGTDYVAPGGALGTPSSGTVTNLTGTASININGTVGATTPNTGAFTTVSATTTGTTGALSVTYNPATASGAAINATGKDSQGGVGYFDFLKITNTTTGATNANKTFRTNSTGQLEVVNSAYGGVILALTDAGNLQAQTLTVNKDVRETVYNLTYAATITPDCANGTIQKVTLTGAVTFSAFANPVAGQSMTLIVTQDATGGRTLTSTMKFSGGSKTLSTAANAVDIISVFYDGTNYWASLGKGFA